MSTWTWPTRLRIRLRSNQAFRGKLSVANNRKTSMESAPQSGELEVFFNARWSAHGARTAPHGLP